METVKEKKSEYLTIRLVKSEMEAVKDIQSELKKRGVEFSLSAIIRTFLTSAFDKQRLYDVQANPSLLLGGV
jgi:hypothetical protein